MDEERKRILENRLQRIFCTSTERAARVCEAVLKVVIDEKMNIAECTLAFGTILANGAELLGNSLIPLWVMSRVALLLGTSDRVNVPQDLPPPPTGPVN